ncbi:MAG: hypothetical protein COA79_03500 [Planctomycetota bacterium]|nr:MAG: hypothetical protein COA79_03500 [Planctomycetota bacterium]
MSDEENEIVREFIIECSEQMDQVDNHILELENDPTNSDLLGIIFRAFHNMKGASGFLGFHKLESLTHVGENLLSKLRDGDIVLSPSITSALMAMGDAVRIIFINIEETGGDGEDDFEKLKSRLSEELKIAINAKKSDVKNSDSDKKEIEKKEEAKDPLDLEIEEALEMAKIRRQKQLLEAKQKLEKEQPSNEEEQPAKEKAVPVKRKRGSDTQTSISDSSIRVNVEVLDFLMNLVGELVLTRNQIVQNYVPTEDSDISKSLQVLNRITSELQEEVMKTRMQPINNMFSKFPRIVRGLADSVNKKIRLDIIGKETELDRTLIESLRDPLTHMVRNSVDHGIESQEKRKANGKDPEGVVVLKAYHESGYVHIDIIDDGAGIDPKIIKAKAIEKNLKTDEQLDSMSDKEIINMIFLPGFSTAEVITNISGRGVGMDVVRTNIEKVGGTVEINSVLGKGSTFNLKVPLTLAIMPALIISVGKERLAIPQVSIQELQLIEKEDMNKLEMLHGTPVLNLRDEFIPLLYLNEQLNIDSEELEKNEQESISVVVLHVDNQMIGLVVDEIFDSQEIVVKPLGPQLEGLTVYAGATILGDGNIALIVDALGLAQKANALSNFDNKIKKAKVDEKFDEVNQSSQLLICRTTDNGRMGIPLDKVLRLESLEKELFEFVGGKEVIKYRGNILQVHKVLNILIDRRKKNRDEENGTIDEKGKKLKIGLNEDVIILEINSIEVGLICGEIMDTFNVYLNEMGASTRKGVMGTLVIDEKVIEVLDVEDIIKTADPHIFSMDVG